MWIEMTSLMVIPCLKKALLESSIFNCPSSWRALVRQQGAGRASTRECAAVGRGSRQGVKELVESPGETAFHKTTDVCCNDQPSLGRCLCKNLFELDAFYSHVCHTL